MDLETIKGNLERIAAIGVDENGGISRMFGTPFIQEAQGVLKEYFEDCGMKAWVDSAGNVHGVLKSEKPDAREILIGSHYDTVKQGGMFDGLMGVVAGAEIGRDLYDKKCSLAKDIHVIATNGEEGNDLGGTFGSRAMTGLLDTESEAYLAKAKTFGYSGEDLKNAVLDTSRADCYLELHIEQGPTLDKYKEQIGIVTGIVGLRRYKVIVHGVSNHAGTTMMEDRDDALTSAAGIILMADELARELGHHFVKTFGVLQVFPGTVATIPNRVEMILEIRNEDQKLMDRFMEVFLQKAKKMAKVDVEPVVAKAPVKCSGRIAEITEKICKEEGIRCRIMPSGATHDGNAMASKVPVGMIFVPSKSGISHSKEEWTDWKDVYTGISVLYKVIQKLESEGKVC